MSSELSNALNPNVVTARRPRPSRPSVAENDASAVEPQRPPLPSRPFVPHRSELELAISEPQLPIAAAPAYSGNPPSRQTAAVQELLRVLSGSKQAAELERKRRQEWEKEQEERLTQRQADMERQMLEMRQELSLLRAQSSVQSPAASPVAASPAPPRSSPLGDTAIAYPSLAPAVYSAPLPFPSPAAQMASVRAGTLLPYYRATNSTPPVEPLYDDLPTGYPHGISGFTNSPQPALYSPPSNALITPEHTPRLLAVQPRTPATNATSSRSPTFVEGSSTQPYATPRHSPNISVPGERKSDDGASSLSACDLLPVPDRRVGCSPPASTLGKRRTPHYSGSDGSDESDNYVSSELANRKLRKRQNGHDKRCFTIHHAMRAHILRLMWLSNDKDLPDSHVEGEPLLMDNPIRFIWEKTSKQSSHNAAMKRRIIADLQTNRAMYKHVPDRDFARKCLENVFDQAFTTLRQKFRTQRDTAAASLHKRREDQKALKARRLLRKKTKLTNRMEARKRLDMFAHPAFDGALQHECLSSEESCDDHDDEDVEGRLQKRTKTFRIRGLPWRSLRLQRFYALLDEEDRVDKSSKPKRGVGRIERTIGPDKDPDVLPPVGTSRWMISKRWVRLMQCTRPELAPVVTTLVSVPDGIDWDECAILGAESDDEADLQEIARLDRQIPVSDSNSLRYALNSIS